MAEHFTQSGIPLKPLYRPEDVAGLDYEADLGDPGQYPFTRGNRLKTGKGAWISRELSGEGDPSISNAQIKGLLAMGQTGMDLIGDSPTQGLLDLARLVEHARVKSLENLVVLHLGDALLRVWAQRLTEVMLDLASSPGELIEPLLQPLSKHVQFSMLHSASPTRVT